MNRIAGLLLVVLVAGPAKPGQAANLITNGSFETPVPDQSWPVAPGGAYSYVNPTPWQVAGRAGPSRLASLPFPGGAPDGLQVAFAGDDVSPGTLTQIIPAFLTAGVTYNMSGFIGSRADYTGGGAIELQTTSGVTLARGGASPPPGTFSLVAFSFTPPPDYPRLGQQLRVVLMRTDGHQANFDDIRLTAVPEPASMLFAQIGLLAFVSRVGARAFSQSRC